MYTTKVISYTSALTRKQELSIIIRYNEKVSY